MSGEIKGGGKVLGQVLNEKESAAEERTKNERFKIFITHSRKDSEGKDFFQKIFSQSYSAGFWYSDHTYDPPHHERIINVMRGCSSVFVLLSEEMQNPHTSSWVSYEVGAAKALGKNVWVFENPEKPAINILVPGADAYVQRPSTIDDIEKFGYMEVVNQGGMILPRNIIRVAQPGKPAKQVLVGNPFDSGKFEHIVFIACAYKSCKQRYFCATLKGVNEYLCPSCRRRLAWNK
jgi:hypothetical protein